MTTTDDESATGTDGADRRAAGAAPRRVAGPDRRAPGAGRPGVEGRLRDGPRARPPRPRTPTWPPRTSCARIPEGRRRQPRLAAVRRREAPRRHAQRLRVGRGRPSGGAGASSGRGPGRRGRSVVASRPATAGTRTGVTGGERRCTPSCWRRCSTTRTTRRSRPRSQGPLADVLRLRHAMDRHATPDGSGLGAAGGGRPAGLRRRPHPPGPPAGDHRRPGRLRAARARAGPRSRRRWSPGGSTCPAARRARANVCRPGLTSSRAPRPTGGPVGLRCRWRRHGARARPARGSGWRRRRPGCGAPCPAW